MIDVSVFTGFAAQGSLSPEAFAVDWQNVSQRLLVTLLHFLWQGTLLAVLSVVLQRLFSRSNANHRYVLLTATFLIMPLAALVTFTVVTPPESWSDGSAESMYPGWSSAQTDIHPGLEGSVTPAQLTMSPNPVANDVATALLVDNGIATDTILTESPKDPSRSSTSRWMSRHAVHCSMAYFLGVCIMLVRLLIAIGSGARIRKTSQSLDDGSVGRLVKRISREIGMKVSPMVASCHRISVPSVIGVLQPTILLPPSLITNLSPHELAAILSHEIAHIRRFDLWVNLAQRLIESLLFFHPAVWWLSRQVSLERENCCDDMVVRTGHRPTDYVGALLRMAELCTESKKLRLDRNIGILSADGHHPSELARRVERLLQMHSKPRLAVSRFASVTVAIALVLGVTYAGAVAQVNRGGEFASDTTTGDSQTGEQDVDRNSGSETSNESQTQNSIQPADFAEQVKKGNPDSGNPDSGDSDSGDSDSGNTDSGSTDNKNTDRSLENRLLASRTTLKADLLKNNGGDVRTEAAVTSGLKWILAQQQPDGFWVFEPMQPDDDTPGDSATVSATAMALMTLAGAGHTHQTGEHRDAVKRGAQWIISKQSIDGQFPGQPLYVHGLGLNAIVELYAMTRDPALKEAAQKAVDFAVDAQNPTQGGWRYTPKRDGDTSVTCWFVTGLSTARQAGLTVPENTWKLASKYIESAKSESGYSYTPSAPLTPSMTAAGLLCDQLLRGQRRSDSFRRAAESLGTNSRFETGTHDFYRWYHESLALCNYGGIPWQNWNQKMKSVIPQLQVTAGDDAGSWAPEKSPFGKNAGRLYTTCLAVMTLESYYRGGVPVIDTGQVNQDQQPPSTITMVIDGTNTQIHASSDVKVGLVQAMISALQPEGLHEYTMHALKPGESAEPGDGRDWVAVTIHGDHATVKPSANLAYKYVVGVIDALTKKGFQKVQLAPTDD